MNDFLTNLKDVLSYQNLTQKELAAMTDISVNTIRGWFSKNLTPDVFTAVKIAQALNVSVEYLVLGKEENIYKNKYLNLVEKLSTLVSSL